MPSDPVALPVTFTCKTKGYESHLTVDGTQPGQAADLLVAWLEFQLRYLQVLRPGETVTATKSP